MKNLLSALLLSISLTLLPATAGADTRPEVGRYVNAYTGEENTTVYVVRLGPAKNSEALVLVTGIDNALDGVVQKATVVNDGYHRSYMVKNGSDQYEILRLDRAQGQLLLSAMPNGLGDYRVAYSSERSRSAEPEHLLTQWLEQGSRPR